MLIPGPLLTDPQRRQVLAAYVHRHTAIGPGKYYSSDEDWIRTHAFHFTKQGHLARNRHYAEPFFGTKSLAQIKSDHEARVRRVRNNPKTFHIRYPGGEKPCRICGSPRPAARVAPLCDLCLRKMGYDTPTGPAYKRKPKSGWSTRNPAYMHMVGLNPCNPKSLKYVYRPGVLDRFTPTVMAGRPIPPGTLVRVLAKRPAGGKTIAGWSRTFAWIADIHGNEQIVFKRALQKTSAHGY